MVWVGGVFARFGDGDDDSLAPHGGESILTPKCIVYLKEEL